jgi:hypothetical protein
VIGAVLITVLVLGALGAIGFGLYQLGYQNGLVETGAEVVVTNPAPIVSPGYWGWGHGFGWGFFGLFFKIFFVVLIIGLISRLFFGPRRWGPPGYWGGPWHDEHRVAGQEKMEEWHRQAHQPPAAPPAPDA